MKERFNMNKDAQVLVVFVIIVFLNIISGVYVQYFEIRAFFACATSAMFGLFYVKVYQQRDNNK